MQREMAKMILRCSPNMANEVAVGELGWWTLKGRRDLLRLKYWGTIVEMKRSRLVKQVYVESRKRLEAGKQSKWCADTKALLTELGLDEAWARKTWTDEEQKGMEQHSVEGNQQQGTEGVERKGTTETEAENLHPYQEGTLLRGILGRARLQSKSR